MLFRSGIVASDGNSSGLSILPLAASREPEMAQLITSLSLTDAEAWHYDRFIKQLKLAGIWSLATAWSGSRLLITCKDTKAHALVNLLNPTSATDSVEVGTLTFSAFTGISTSGTGNYIETNVPLSAMNPNSICCGGIPTTNNAGAAGAYDMGVLNASSNGIRFMGKSTASVAAGQMFGTALSAIGATTDWDSVGARGICSDGTSILGYGNAVLQATAANTPSALSDSDTFSFLVSKRATAASKQTWVMLYLLPGLTAEQHAVLHSAGRCLIIGLLNGLPNVQPAGYGDATVDTDVCIYGDSLSAFVRAWRTAHLGKTVALVLPPEIESVEQFGGMPANGLGYVDIKSVTTPTSGIFAEMGKEIATRIGATWGNTQSGMSFQPSAWNTQVRKMFDPTRNSGTLPGQNVTVYMSSGLKSVTRGGIGQNSTVTTNDGRVFTARKLGEESYDGDLLKFAGVPVRTGHEAVGTGEEAANGWQPTALTKPGHDADSTTYDVSIASLPHPIPALPSRTTGDAYVGAQTAGYRLAGTSTKSRRASFWSTLDGSAPPNYDATKYELLGRYFDAVVAAGGTRSNFDLLTFARTVSSTPQGTIADLNNGPAAFGDLFGGGTLYISAGTDLTVRAAARAAIMDWARGLYYWLGHSGDSRILAATATTFGTSWGLDTKNFGDYVSWKPRFWPGMLYRRDPAFRLASTFVLDANDVIAANGATPRSTTTIGDIKYNGDHHGEDWVDDGSGLLKYQGARNAAYNTVLGANGYFPWPLEASLPDKTNGPNISTSTCPSMTQLVWDSARVEPTICQVAESLACVDSLAIDGSIANQDVDPAALRTLILAGPGTVTPDIPQTA